MSPASSSRWERWRASSVYSAFFVSLFLQAPPPLATELWAVSPAAAGLDAAPSGGRGNDEPRVLQGGVRAVSVASVQADNKVDLKAGARI